MILDCLYPSIVGDLRIERCGQQDDYALVLSRTHDGPEAVLVAAARPACVAAAKACFAQSGKVGLSAVRSTPGDVARVFKAMAKLTGISPELMARISGHSSRVGAAQDQVRHGVELPAVMQAGGWSSPTMVARYSAKLEVRRGGAAIGNLAEQDLGPCLPRSHTPEIR